MDTHERHQPLTITVERAGQLLGISRSLAYDLVHRGEIPAIRLGRRLVVPVRVIEEMLAVRPSDLTVSGARDQSSPSTRFPMRSAAERSAVDRARV
jgi:excisionase family DNA binding protein